MASGGLFKDVKAMLNNYVADFGLVVEQRKKHFSVFNPATNTRITVSISPSDRRALLNIRSDLRRLTGGQS